MRNLATKIALGLQAGDTSVKKLGIDHATAQRIYRQMKTDNYDGSLAFYVCEKLADDVLGDLRLGLKLFEKSGQEFPPTEGIVKMAEVDVDRDVLFCALQGALLKATDKVGKKCLDIIHHLYLLS